MEQVEEKYGFDKYLSSKEFDVIYKILLGWIRWLWVDFSGSITVFPWFHAKQKLFRQIRRLGFQPDNIDSLLKSKSDKSTIAIFTNETSCERNCNDDVNEAADTGMIYDINVDSVLEDDPEWSETKAYQDAKCYRADEKYMKTRDEWAKFRVEHFVREVPNTKKTPMMYLKVCRHLTKKMKYMISK